MNVDALISERVPGPAPVDATVREILSRTQSAPVEIVREPLPERKRRMLELYVDLTLWARKTVQHAWAAGADQVLCDPSGGCKLIFPRQWTEAMRVASALYAGHQGIKSLGAPDAVAHPSGRARRREQHSPAERSSGWRSYPSSAST